MLSFGYSIRARGLRLETPEVLSAESIQVVCGLTTGHGLLFSKSDSSRIDLRVGQPPVSDESPRP